MRRWLLIVAALATTLLLAGGAATAAQAPVVHTVSATISVPQPGLGYNVLALCPAGEVATGGGFHVNPGGMTNYWVDGNEPHSTNGSSPDGWLAGLDYYGSAPFTLTAYAVCVG